MSKKLPDLRRGYSFDDPPPRTEAFEEIERRFQFPAEFLLPKRLQVQWEWWHADEALGTGPTGAEIKTFLKQTAMRAAALEEALDNAGGLGTSRLYDAVVYPTLDLTVLKRQAHLLWRAAMIAQRWVPPSTSGPKSRRVRNNLIAHLWLVWREAKGSSAPRITNFGNEYSGDFLDFVGAVFKVFGETVPLKNALGKAIVTVLRKMDEMSERDRIAESHSNSTTN